MGSEIFAPMLAVVLLTFFVWVYMFAKRIPYLQSLDVPADQITGRLLDDDAPAQVSNPSNNLKNLFEMPVLFYVVCLYLFAVGQVDTTYIIAAWLFAVLRVAHSIVHCTFNIVMVRFLIYLVSCIAVWFMLFRAILTVL